MWQEECINEHSLYSQKGRLKDTDLVKEELPTERAFGVNWNFEKNALCFKVKLMEKPRSTEVRFLC